MNAVIMSFDPNKKQSGFHSCPNKREWCGAFVAWSVRVSICISAARVHQYHKILGPLLELGPMGPKIINIMGPPLNIHFGKATQVAFGTTIHLVTSDGSTQVVFVSILLMRLELNG